MLFALLRCLRSAAVLMSVASAPLHLAAGLEVTAVCIPWLVEACKSLSLTENVAKSSSSQAQAAKEDIAELGALALSGVALLGPTLIVALDAIRATCCVLITWTTLLILSQSGIANTMIGWVLTHAGLMEVATVFGVYVIIFRLMWPCQLLLADNTAAAVQRALARAAQHNTVLCRIVTRLASSSRYGHVLSKEGASVAMLPVYFTRPLPFRTADSSNSSYWHDISEINSL